MTLFVVMMEKHTKIHAWFNVFLVVVLKWTAKENVHVSAPSLNLNLFSILEVFRNIIKA